MTRRDRQTSGLGKLSGLDKLYPEMLDVDLMYRVHIYGNDPTSFDRQGLFRYDAPESQFKTYYFGCSPAAAFLETLGGIRTLPQQLVSERVVTRFNPGSSVMRIADLTDRCFRKRFSLRFDGDLGDYVGTDLDRPILPCTFTQDLALRFWQSGYEGIRYFTSYQYQPEETSLALFTNRTFAELDLKPGETEPITELLLSEMRHRFGVEVYPADPLPW